LKILGWGGLHFIRFSIKIINKQLKPFQMKKVFAIFAIAALAACGGASTEVKTDSTAVKADSTAVKADSTKVDSAAVKVDSAAKK
jgi:hypothetical protein